ncbi:MAG: LCCL domain-containing protein [Burkholderiaceae bacterium]|jgi:hypothetical protein
MKVIHELVAHFDRRGRLDPERLSRLMAQGLLAHDAPRTMLEHCGRPGRTWCFRVTGDVEGPVWGSDTYTGDSSIAAAAVHAGVAQPGEATVVRIVVVEPPERFEGSLRHGVASRDYARFDTAFRFERVDAAVTPAG